MTVKRKFNFALAILTRDGKAILDACLKYAAQLMPRLQAARVAELQGYLTTVTSAVSAKKQKLADVGDLTVEQNKLLTELRRCMANARDFAGRAFKGQAVKLKEEFQIAEHKKNDLASIVARAEIILGSCQKAENKPAMAAKGWLDSDEMELSNAIDALTDTDETQETGKGEGKLDTTTVNTAANNLYDGLIDVQVIADKVFAATNPMNVAIRDEFRLKTFPPPQKHKPAPAPAPAP